LTHTEKLLNGLGEGADEHICRSLKTIDPENFIKIYPQLAYRLHTKQTDTPKAWHYPLRE